MSLPLADLGTIKVHPEVHAVLRAFARMENEKELNAFVRRILHEWAKERVHALNLANEFAKERGLTGITGDWE
jgi:hypothetical protein